MYLLDFLHARYHKKLNERSERFRKANFTIQFFSGTERNGLEQNSKNVFILAPRKVVARMVKTVQHVQCERSISEVNE